MWAPRGTSCDCLLLHFVVRILPFSCQSLSSAGVVLLTSSMSAINPPPFMIPVDGSRCKVRKKVLVDGDPQSSCPPLGSNVTVHYKGYLLNGSKPKDIGDSRVKNRPLTFRLGHREVIRGWDFALRTFRLGEKSTVWVAASYAYGDKGVKGEIPPKRSLMFEIELIGWEAPPPHVGY